VWGDGWAQVAPEQTYDAKYKGVGRSMPDARIALYGRQILEVGSPVLQRDDPPPSPGR
jgi:hypothetical protein